MSPLPLPSLTERDFRLGGGGGTGASNAGTSGAGPSPFIAFTAFLLRAATFFPLVPPPVELLPVATDGRVWCLELVEL